MRAWCIVARDLRPVRVSDFRSFGFGPPDRRSLDPHWILDPSQNTQGSLSAVVRVWVSRISRKSSFMTVHSVHARAGLIHGPDCHCRSTDTCTDPRRFYARGGGSGWLKGGRGRVPNLDLTLTSVFPQHYPFLQLTFKVGALLSKISSGQKEDRDQRAH